MTHGTASEVVLAAGLATWQVTGDSLYPLAERLRSLPGIEDVVTFGTTLHVSGRDAAQLEASIHPFRKGPGQWERIEPGLEDVFIHLMREARDNFV
jgi:ABC-2 type transport system ATP-binding protein